MILTRTASLILAGILITGCKFNKDQSSAKHKVGEPITDKSWAFADVTVEDYLAYKRKAKEHLTMDKLVGENDKRFQLISSDIKRIDELLRKKYPDELRDVPSPKLALIESDISNAFISHYPVCYNVELKLGGFVNIRNVEAIYVNNLTDSFEPYAPVEGANCSEKPVDEFEKARLHFNSRKTGCNIEKHKNGYKVSGKCEKSLLLAGVNKSKKIVMYHTANVVIVYTGLLKKLQSRASLFGVLAHELSHYYKSHLSAFPEEYDYFYYEIDHKNEKPKPVPALKEKGDRLALASKTLEAFENMAGFDYQGITPYNYFLYGGLVYEGRDRKISSCEKAAEFLKSTDANFKISVKRYPFSGELKYVSQLNLKKVLDVQKSCYDEFESDLKQNPDKHKGSSFLSLLSPEFIHSITGTDDFRLYARLKALYTEAENYNGLSLIEHIQNGKKYIDDGLSKAYKTLREAHKEGVAWYTTEQEADEVSLEILSEFSLPKETLFHYTADLLKGKSVDPVWGKLVKSEKDCLELYTNGFKDENGEDIRVPVGSFSEDHHSSCYRLYNAYREAQIHTYEQKGEPLFDLQAWEDEFKGL